MNQKSSSKLGTRIHRELIDADLEIITNTYHRWHRAKGAGKSEVQSGQFNFCLN